MNETTPNTPAGKEADLLRTLRELLLLKNAMGVSAREIADAITPHIAALQADKERQAAEIKLLREFVEEVAVAEDRSNLDGDSAETVLQQLNDAAEDLIDKIDAARGGAK